MKAYTVKYIMNPWDDKERFVVVPANNKYEAYDKAVYEVIPEIEPYSPYGAWVAGVTYNNGNHKEFNTFCGKRY